MTARFEQDKLLRYIRIDGQFGVQSGGGNYFYTSMVDGVAQIFKSDKQHPWPHQLTFFVEGVDGYSISPDGKVIAVFINNKGSEHNPIALVNTTTGHARIIFEEKNAQAAAICWKKDSTVFLFRSNHENGQDFKIYEYHVFENEYKKIIDCQGWAAPLEYSPEGKYILYLVASSNADQNLYLHEISTNINRCLTPHENNISFEAAYARQEQELYILSNENNEFCKLYHWDLNTNIKTPVGPNIDWELSGLSVSSDGRYIMFSANEEGYSNLYLIDGWLNHELPTPETKGIISSYSFTDDLEILFCYEFPKRPSQVYVFNWTNSRLRQLTWSNFQGLNPHNFIQPELIHYKSFDGLEIPAFLFLPAQYRPGKPIPMICHFHGGPESQYRPNFSKIFQYFLELGIGICTPNIRGSSGYGAHYMSLDDYKKRPDSVQDGIELAKYLIEKKYTVKERLAVMGGSYGGFMVLSLIAAEPELFAAAIDVVGIANLVTFLKNTSPYRRKLREAEYGPLSDEEFLKSVSPIYKMHLVKTPLLVVHGATDPRVPLNEAEQVVESLQKNHQVVENLFFDDEGHGIRKQANQLIYYRKAIEFLLTHIVSQ